jgi:hypothetical protein
LEENLLTILKEAGDFYYLSIIVERFLFANFESGFKDVRKGVVMCLAELQVLLTIIVNPELSEVVDRNYKKLDEGRARLVQIYRDRKALKH